ncbi:penicillin-binding protein activator [Erythrobacter sp. LQ02-29]|uniref:penicillin-binding protein activator n=1 Tax=unclassified Erythrobacter TaxID=2633097 RepID=UPI001BFC5543|nr:MULTISPECIES: penicillin-binding protein activator [unclassified Erythrobacter]MCP9223212.1 penicillin-binding protein activator [Erythrobacter sp. LQ02-29]QWC58175.1 ABC transporter substrate-binding protein [Erythrobacter sp. 3-20A1M]
MSFSRLNRRSILVVAAALLAGCQIIPKAPQTSTPGPAPEPTAGPSTSTLPSDETRHRVALLVPLSGSNGAVGQSIANATTMALLDTGAENLRITTYDTASGARTAARQAIADGNRLILGPLMSNDVGDVLAEARPADVPLISFSNDAQVARADVFVMGHIPSESIERTVRYAGAKGARRFAALIPDGEYGSRAEQALKEAVARVGGTVTRIESYSRSNTSIVSAAQRLRQNGGFDAVLVADGADRAIEAAKVLHPGGSGPGRIIGTELWSGEAALTRNAAMRGAQFAAVSDARFRKFSDSYKTRFGGQPFRISTLGYDSVLLALRVATDWKPGTPFPTRKLLDQGGFLGLDGAFRFEKTGLVERAMEVREVRDGEVVIVDQAPSRFGN